MPKGVPNKKYTSEFKKLVVETMLKEKFGYNNRWIYGCRKRAEDK